MDTILARLVGLSVQLKVAHWQATDYNLHKELDGLCDSFSGGVDELLESWYGPLRKPAFGDAVPFTFEVVPSATSVDAAYWVGNITGVLREALRAAADENRLEVQDIIYGMLNDLNTALFHLKKMARSAGSLQA